MKGRGRRFVGPVVVAGAAAALAGLPGCGLQVKVVEPQHPHLSKPPGKPASEPGAKPGGPSVSGRVVRAAVPSTVRIRAWSSDGSAIGNELALVHGGSGWAIGRNEIGTASHVIQGSNHFQVQSPGGSWRRARLVGVDKTNDFAVLEVPGARYKPLPLATDSPQPNSGVATIGYPGKEQRKTISRGVVWDQESLVVDSYGGTVPSTVDFLGINVDHGNSGGALINASGQVVGDVVQGVPGGGEGVAVDINVIRPDIKQALGH